ncbi:MAG: hypothetical protein GWP91_09375 [Rhodobacterales bacterium]|nr:hypothetical protein [Rhodobacterales bacterium]
MVILGIADGLDTGAALVVDDQLVAVAHQGRIESQQLTRTFPWEAMDTVLAQAGLRPRDVDLITFAGRITPPFVIRRHPSLRRAGRDPFSPAVDAKVFFQAILSSTGLSALEADRAAEWLEAKVVKRGYAPNRLLLVDIHRCLVAAGYRGQPRDHALMLSLHPGGDGAALAVYRGRSGQVDRVFQQKGFSALHVPLHRCAAALDLSVEDVGLMWNAAGSAQPDPALVRLLGSAVWSQGPKLSRRSYPLPVSRHSELYAALKEADRATAAASVLENLCQAVCGVVRHHIAQADTNGLVLCGEVFDNPRLCARVAELIEVEWTAVYPEPGWRALAVGAALVHGGLHPRLLARPGLGRAVSDKAAKSAMRATGLVADSSLTPAQVLADGGALGRFVGPSGWGRWSCGSRTVLVRADQPEGVERVRIALGRDPLEEPALAILADEVATEIPLLHELHAGHGAGAFAPKVSDKLAEQYPGGITADQRAILHVVDEEDPGLWRLLSDLRERTGCGAVAMFPFAMGRDPVVDRAVDAARTFQQAKLDGLEIGTFMVCRSVET